MGFPWSEPSSRKLFVRTIHIIPPCWQKYNKLLCKTIRGNLTMLWSLSPCCLSIITTVDNKVRKWLMKEGNLKVFHWCWLQLSLGENMTSSLALQLYIILEVHETKNSNWEWNISFYQQLHFQSHPGVASEIWENEAESCLAVAYPE